MNQLHFTQNDATDTGSLQVNVTSALRNTPIPDATVTLSDSGAPERTLDSVRTDESGQTGVFTLSAPPVAYSMDAEQENQPFSLYTIRILAEGYHPLNITGVEIFSTIKAIQNAALTPLEYDGRFRESIDIPANTLFGDYPPKIEESEIKPIEESGEIVLSRVVIPEYIIVHDGPPTDSRANDYYVRYRDYIKNVASSEIYATWPDAAIRANVLAIMSFTLNRVYTEWYRNRGYNFTITSSTAYDQKWSYGRTIYDSIDRIVDEMFENYLSRPNVTQPILTQYCDGRSVSCPNWLSQWGSKYLGDQGYSAIQILRNYYGNSIYINTADEISGIPSSWPGYDLTIGSSGSKVRQLQQQLNRIHQNYPAIPAVTPDGIFGSSTRDAVRSFQSVFGLPATGIVDYPTWYKISEIYVAVSRIAELN